MVFFKSKRGDMVLFSIVLFHGAVYLYIERKMYNKDIELTQFQKNEHGVLYRWGTEMLFYFHYVEKD